MLITVNMLIKYKNSDGIERVIWIDYFNSFLYLIKVDNNTCKPELKKIEEINDGLENQYIEVIEEDENVNIINENDISEKHKEIRDRAWQVIKYIYKEPDVFDCTKRRKLIIAGSEKFNLSERVIYKYLKKYWQGGMCKNALLPDYYNCGAKGKEKSNSSKKRGRPKKYSQTVGVNIDDDIKRIFRIALQKYYYNSKQNALTTAYELMKREFFTDDFKIENGIKIPLLKEENVIPSIGQFRYWFNKERNIKKEVSTRKSSKKYQLENRPLLGESTSEAYGPGSLYQIDATVGDICLVSRYNQKIIGRPIIYMVMDVFSRCITGIYIGLEGPSWAGAMMALANSATDKVQFCKEYGIDISESQWPIQYIPETIVADRGEFEGKVAEELINGLNIKIKNTPSFRGDLKGIVERCFNSIHSAIKAFTPGFINSDFQQRGVKDYKLYAQLDIYHFTQIVIKYVLHYNNFHLLKNYSKEEMMIQDGIERIPISLWTWGIKNRSGKLRSYPEDVVRLNLLPKSEGTITANGIKFKGVYYSCELAIKERWFEKARNNGSRKIPLCFDSRNMNSIYIKNDDNRGYEKCFILEHQERYKNKILEEITHLHYTEKLNEKKLEQEVSQRKIDLFTEIESIVKEAKKSSKQSIDNESNRSKLKGIKLNRSLEKEKNREREAFNLGNNERIEESKILSLNNTKDNKEENVGLLNIDLFKNKQKERFDEE